MVRAASFWQRCGTLKYWHHRVSGAFMAAMNAFPFSGANQSAKAVVMIRRARCVAAHSSVAQPFEEMLQRQFKIEYSCSGSVWVRISCQIYNQIEDYQTLGQVVCRIVGSEEFYSELKKRALVEPPTRGQVSQGVLERVAIRVRLSHSAQ